MSDFSFPQRTPTFKRYFGDSWQTLAWIIGVGLVIALIVGSIWGGISAYKGSERDVITMVNEKERVCKSGGGDCDYLLFTDAGTFKVGDTLLYGRFNTSDVYGRIQEHQKYKLHVVGWRVGVFSMYPNVLKADSTS